MEQNNKPNKQRIPITKPTKRTRRETKMSKHKGGHAYELVEILNEIKEILITNCFQ